MVLKFLALVYLDHDFCETGQVFPELQTLLVASITVVEPFQHELEQRGRSRSI